MEAPIHLICLILGLLLFLLAGLGEFFVATPWPWTLRLVAWGLFFVTLSTIVRV